MPPFGRSDAAALVSAPQNFVAPFEVLAQSVVPGLPGVPFIQQGFFIQLFNITPGTPQSIAFFATPGFASSQGGASLTANYIDPNGNVTDYTSEFLQNSGFVDVQMDWGSYIFGVQYTLIPTEVRSLTAANQPTGFGTRGIAILDNQAKSPSVFPLATVRQTISTFDANDNQTFIGGSAYSVPVTSAGTR